jgi:cell division protein ZapA
VEEEEGVRKATKLINDKIKDYEENFAVRDKQDLLAMCALQLATEMVKSENQGGATNPDMMDNTINEIDQLLDQILDKK